MAEEVPFNPDFFQTITDVSFGGAGWLLLLGGSPSSNGIEFDFVGLSGGTPGLLLTSMYEALPTDVQFTGAPLVKADLVRKFTLAAGKPIVGLAAFSFDTGLITMYLGLSTVPPKFTVRVRNNSTVPVEAGVILYKPFAFKAGYNLQSPGFPSADTTGLPFALDAGKSKDVLVNTASFKVG